MRFDLGRTLSRSLSISWRHRWLWLLGVFGGAGGSFNFNSTTGNRSGGGPQFGQFVSDHLALILALVAVILVLAIVAFVISCIAVPASIWAGLQLDVGHEVGLRMAWRAGTARGWRYFRLVLVKGLLGLGIVLAFGVFLLLGIAIFAAGGRGTIPVLVLGGLVLVPAFVLALVIYAYGTLWSERMLVILELGALDSLKAGWWLVRRQKLNTFIFALVFGLLQLVISIGVFLVALLLASPGIVMVVVFFTHSGVALGLAIIGFTWIVILGLGTLIVGGGYLGALNQVGFAIAGRDMAIEKRMPVRPEVIGWDPYSALPVPA